jgi:hypothetical protein
MDEKNWLAFLYEESLLCNVCHSETLIFFLYIYVFFYFLFFMFFLMNFFV